MIMCSSKFQSLRSLKLSILLLLLTFSYLTSAEARISKVKEYSNSYQLGETDLRLMGSGLKKFLTFKVVSVGLYVADGYASNQVLEGISKRIEVNYLLNFSKGDLQKATIDGIAKNVTKDEFKKLESRIQQIVSYYPDVKHGDQIVINYIPEVGSEVIVNGQKKGIVEGKDFAFAFFSIWVGKNPVDHRIKSALLGLNKI